MAKNNTIGSLGTGELRPGVAPRRWEPEYGVKKLNEKIHKESKFADDYKKLPFSFSKPTKSGGRNSIVQCDNCGKVFCGTTSTVGVICRGCNKFSSVTEVIYEDS